MAREDTVYNAEIRVNTEIFSTVADTTDIIQKTVFIENDHNEDLKYYLQVARDSAFTKPFNISSETTLSKNTEDVILLTDYYPYLRVRIKYDSAPSSGDLKVYIHKKVSA